MQVRVMRGINPVVEKLLQTFSRSNAEMMSALRARLQTFVHRFAPDDLPARIAFLPQSFGAHILFAVAWRAGLDRWFLPCEPGHVISATTVTRAVEPATAPASRDSALKRDPFEPRSVARTASIHRAPIAIEFSAPAAAISSRPIARGLHPWRDARTTNGVLPDPRRRIAVRHTPFRANPRA